MTVITYRALWLLEIALLVLLFLILRIPILDYSKREFFEYQRNPSPQTLQAFRDKNEEEFRVRELTALPVAILAIASAIPIFRNRHRKPF
jgi:hypothetical protein